MSRINYFIEKSIHRVIILILGIILTSCAGAMPNSSWPNASLDKNKLLVSNNQAMYAISADNGQLLWQFPNQADKIRSQFYSPPAYDSKHIYVASDTKNLFALDKNTGNEIWSFDGTNDKSGTAPSYVTTNSTIVLFASAQMLYAIDNITGNLEWEFESEEDIWSAPLATDSNI